MVEMMTKRTVLVVPPELYYRRYALEDAPNSGLGSTFESGLLLQRTVEAQGANKHIIPVLLDAADARYVPDFLRDLGRYDLSKERGYEKLLRRLTNQPAHPKPPLGFVSVLPPRWAKERRPTSRH